MSNKNDEDFCEKKFPSHHDFADGLFSIGCACELSITYGFELMLEQTFLQIFDEQKSEF